MRVLVDTNVLVRAAGKARGPAREVFLRLLDPQHTIVASAFLLDELHRVLGYPRVQSVHGLSPSEAEQYVRDVAAAAHVIAVPAALPFRVPHDPDDDPVIAAAVYGRVDVLCTRDRHLRRQVVMDYCAQFNIRIQTDTELLSELGTGP